jgi:hypothetical protein
VRWGVPLPDKKRAALSLNGAGVASALQTRSLPIHKPMKRFRHARDPFGGITGRTQSKRLRRPIKPTVEPDRSEPFKLSRNGGQEGYAWKQQQRCA